MKKIIPSLLILFLTSCTLGAKNSAKIIEGKYKFSNNSFVFYKDIKVDNLCINFVSIDSIEKETTIICKVTNKTFNIVTNFSSNENFSVNYTIGEKVYPIPDSYNVIFNIKIDNTIADISTRIQFFTSFKEGSQQTNGFRMDIDYFKINNEKINEKDYYLPGIFYLKENKE